MKLKIFILAVCLILCVSFSGCGQREDNEIRIGFFPNLTHSQAVFGYANGDFENAFKSEYGDDMALEWISFNSGPSEIEAMFAGEVDIGYIGPIPAINGFIKSSGDVKIIAGATLDGALLVTREDVVLNEISELEGLNIAIPQFGNTQHICLLNILSENNIKTVENGGSTMIIESSNPDIKTLMDKGDIDAALVPEPWATRLVDEINANIFLDYDRIWNGGDYSVALIIVDREFAEKHPDYVETFLKTHVEVTNYINANVDEAMTVINDKIGNLTGNKLSDSVLKSSFANMIVTYDPSVETINQYMIIYQNGGFTDEIKNKEEIYDFSVLNKVLKDLSLPEVGN